MSPRWQRLSIACGLIAMALGALTLFGWATGFEALASLRAKYIPMAPTTALAFSALGIALFAQRGSRRWQRLFAWGATAAVALLAAAKLAELYLGIPFGIDERLVADPKMFGAVRKGRMAPVTAGNLLAISAAMACLLHAPWRAFTGRIASLVAGVSMVILLGYLYGTPLLYGGSVVPVALPTAIAFLFLSASLILAAGPATWPLVSWVEHSTRTVLVRWFLPLMVGGALVNGWVLTKLHTTTQLNPALISAVATLALASVLTPCISQVARILGTRLDRAEAARSAAQEELRQLNGELEHRIAQRTAELQLKNREMQEELELARELQMAMLPKHFPSLPPSAAPAESALRFFTFYFPTGDVSGDFFNVFPISDSQVGVVICDVMGHGVRAALVTSMVRALSEQYGPEISDPAALLARINSKLVAMLKNTGLVVFVTSFAIIADTGRQRFAFANAGHPRALHVKAQLRETAPLRGKTGPALGLFDGAKYTTDFAAMEPGDLVILFTDGLFEVESPDGTLYTQEDLLTAVQRHSELDPNRLLDALLAEIRAFAQRPHFDDDVCIVGVEVARTGLQHPAG